MAGKCSGIPFWILLDLPPWVSKNQFYEIDKNYDVFFSWTNASFNKVHWSIDRLIIWLIDWLAVWLSVFSSLGHFHTNLDIYYYYLFIVFSFPCRHNLRFRAPKTQVFKNCPKVKIF